MKPSRYLSIIGVIILVILLWRLDLGEIAQTISRIEPVWFLLSLLTIAPICLLRGLRWRLVIRSLGVKYSLWKSTRGYLMGMGLGSLTPGRIGNFVRVRFLQKDRSLSFERSLLTVVVDNLLDIVMLVFVAMLGVLILLIKWHVELVSKEWLIVLSVLAAVTVLSFIFRKRLLRMFEAAVLRAAFLVPVKHRQGFRHKVKTFNTMMKEMERSLLHVVLAFLVNLLNWAFVVLAGYLVARAFSLDISLLFVFAVVSVSAFVSALPISVLGLGTREATVIFLFAFVNIPGEVGLMYSLLVAFVTTFSLAILGGVFWIRR
ncbi:MAG: flippase-like domain-containing protein [Nanoarchaeota archaeon]|nr:flippase-like domain-containing protein [Nanoarchaeota archaeon]